MDARRRLVVAPPDFVGVGVQKAGTTWWWSLISRHPRVWCRSYTVKEQHYFDDLAGTAPEELDAAAYHRLFARPRGMRAGEWTPRYLFDPWAVPLLAAAAPEARILVLLRDPVERYLSGRAHFMRRSGGEDDEVEEDAVARGLYADQLDRLFACFSRDRVLVLQYEHVLSDVLGELRRTYRFLDLPDSFVPASASARVNETTWARPGIDDERAAMLVELYRPQLERLERLLPDFDFSLWPSAGRAPGAPSPVPARPV